MQQSGAPTSRMAAPAAGPDLTGPGLSPHLHQLADNSAYFTDSTNTLTSHYRAQPNTMLQTRAGGDPSQLPTPTMSAAASNPDASRVGAGCSDFSRVSSQGQTSLIHPSQTTDQLGLFSPGEGSGIFALILNGESRFGRGGRARDAARIRPSPSHFVHARSHLDLLAENDKDFQLSAEINNLNQDDISVSTRGNHLVIVAKQDKSYVDHGEGMCHSPLQSAVRSA